MRGTPTAVLLCSSQCITGIPIPHFALNAEGYPNPHMANPGQKYGRGRGHSSRNCTGKS
jgi:hypothetical protein